MMLSLDICHCRRAGDREDARLSKLIEECDDTSHVDESSEQFDNWER